MVCIMFLSLRLVFELNEPTNLTRTYELEIGDQKRCLISLDTYQSTCIQFCDYFLKSISIQQAHRLLLGMLRYLSEFIIKLEL